MTVPDDVRLDAALLRAWALPLDEHGDKYDRGTTLVIGGSSTTPGAVLLAGTSALRMGAGRLQIATDPAVASDIAIAMPEAMVVPLHLDATDPDWRGLVGAARSVLVGPGLDPDANSADLLDTVFDLASAEATIVVDAAALCAVPGRRDGTTVRLILTPNRQEATRLWASLSNARPDRVELDPAAFDDVLAEIAATLGGVVTSFGVVCSPDGRRWRAEDGGPGLSTSGSGDVLAGLAAGAAARTTDPAQAACWATFTHAAAARHLASGTGGIGFLARELADAIGPALAAARGRPVSDTGRPG